MFRNLLSRFFSSASSDSSLDRLTRAEVELVSSIRHSPTLPLSGSELVQAKGLVSRGMLKPAGGQRFLVTEKAVAACRQPRR